MPTIAGSAFSGGHDYAARMPDETRHPSSLKRKYSAGGPTSPPSPMKWKSPRRCPRSSPRSPNGYAKDPSDVPVELRKSPRKKLSDSFDKQNWNPEDIEHLRLVKEALHVSAEPSTVVCRDDEQNRVLEFCKACVEQEKAGSLYVCGCPGTGKSLSIEKVKQLFLNWATEEGLQLPDVLFMNCTSLVNTSEIFKKVLKKHQPRKKVNKSTSALQHLQNLYSQNQQPHGLGMMLVIADELDYLITKDRSVLHDLFMLTTYPYSRCILIGIANAIDLADRFLPKLRLLNCKPMVVTFRAYSKDQVLRILRERLKALPFTAFHPQALELCSRKVAAASGDMRKALCICRSAVELLEAQVKEYITNSNGDVLDHKIAPALGCLSKQETSVVKVDHMVIALSKSFRSPRVDTIRSLPQHQQIILCSAVKLFSRGKKDTTLGELNNSYMNICKSAMIPPVGFSELSSMCMVLCDQGLIKLGQSREDKLRRVTLEVDEADVGFALQEVRFFRNCLT